VVGAIKPGTYVVAVSGGVDSMALLDMLVKQAMSYETGAMRKEASDSPLTAHRSPLIVAHYNHGIREDSHEDRQLVQDVARRHGLPFVYDEGRLGPEASEEVARKARYDFLHRVREASGARAIITAHHQDDLLETAVHNMLRGTGRRGLVSLRSRDRVQRPLLHVSKADLIAYAKDQGLAWREDVTNSDLRYRRNYIRHKILPRLSDEQKQELLQHIRTIQQVHDELETQLVNHLHLHPGKSELNRHWFIMLPHDVAREVLATWLRRHGVKDLDRRTLERLVVAAKTFAPGKQADVDKMYALHTEKAVLALRLRDR
jgi:tRNA(Ile)-lysidine synthase